MAAFTTYLKSRDPLFSFVPNIAAIHCPGDTRFKNQPGAGWAYDSYSKPQSVGGESYQNYWGQGGTYTKLGLMKWPSQTFDFVEDDDNRGYNMGSWVLNWQLATATKDTKGTTIHAESFTWQDPTPIYHGNVSTAGFADGHAEYHRWMDPSLIAYAKGIASGNPNVGFNPPTTKYSTDYEFIYQGFRFPNWKP